MISLEEITVYEYLVARRGIYHSVREVSKALDRERAENENRWAHDALKRLLARGKIERSVAGYYFVPHIQTEGEAVSHDVAAHFGAMPTRPPHPAEMEVAETETMFLERSAVESKPAAAPPSAQSAPEPAANFPGEEKPSEARPSEAIAPARRPKGLPWLGSRPPGK